MQEEAKEERCYCSPGEGVDWLEVARVLRGVLGFRNGKKKLHCKLITFNISIDLATIIRHLSEFYTSALQIKFVHRVLSLSVNHILTVSCHTL